MHSTRTAVLAMLVALLLSAPAVLAETAPPDRSKTAGPISAELAKKCRALTIKAHPTKPAGSKNGAYAQAQRDYFQDCIAKAAMKKPRPGSDRQGKEGRVLWSRDLPAARSILCNRDDLRPHRS